MHSTTSGASSLSSTTARSMRLGTKYGDPACRSEMWAMVNGRETERLGASTAS